MAGTSVRTLSTLHDEKSGNIFWSIHENIMDNYETSQKTKKIGKNICEKI